MVELMLEGLKSKKAESGKKKAEIECFHINCRLATSLEDMGKRPWAKIFPLLRYLIQARKVLREHPIDAIYYCPGRATLNNTLRDLIALSVLRLPTHFPFRISHSALQAKPAIVLHWHAVGLESSISPWPGHPWLSRLHAFVSARVHARLKPHLQAARHIALSRWHAGVLRNALGVDAAVVPYGIPDPAAENSKFKIQKDEFHPGGQKTETSLSSAESTKDQGPGTKNILFMSMLTRAKGFHDTLAAHQELLRSWLAGEEAHPWRLDVAGSFVDEDGKEAWAAAKSDPVLREAEERAGEALLEHHGFVDGEAKAALFQQADVFCFPTRYESESFGLVVLEAMAWGVPVVATNWHALPEIFGNEYPLLLSQDSNSGSQKILSQLIANALNKDPILAIYSKRVQTYDSAYFISSMHEVILGAANNLSNTERTETNRPQ